MSRYSLIQIEDVYLTSDGTSGGSPCKTEIPDLIRLRPAQRPVVIPVIEGPAQVQLFENLIGESFTVRIAYLKNSVLDDLVEVIDTSQTNGEFITVKISGGDVGDFGDFDLECQYEAMIGGSQFSNGILKSVDITFRIAGINEE